ncbi:MAG TPA: glycoside hydrolase family 13 protein [Clostridia bacterium]|nr:glycoside hydrolase family 13 protein [Clostridia bacterium]HQM38848.1 glycoside hydrolase family 13 protein [Clostridia bacterium]
MLEIYFNSRDITYKSLFGAVQSNSIIEFRLDVRCDAPVTAYIIINRRKYQMQLENLIQDLSIFTIKTKALPKPGLMHYHFVISTPYHTVFYGNQPDTYQGEGTKYHKDPLDYQITVYDEYSTPDWIKGRIMYQIFPDRFYKESIIKSPYWERIYHSDWYEDPYIEQDFPSKTMECSDFFGGNLQGIIKKLDYIKSLGVGVIYLNPIYLAYSNHRYDSADYMSIDDTLGTKEDLHELCNEALKRDIYIILDMVFSHTGSDSIYFDKNKTFNKGGAFNNPHSQYKNWYSINEDGTYDSWWGIETLPNTNETDPGFMSHVFDSIEQWLSLGVKGFRLDVADELPDIFIKELRKMLKSFDPEAVLIGEVWEDASNKYSYGAKREYLYGYELDSVMNYPYRNAIINYALGSINAECFVRQIEIIRENYPLQSFECLMNMLSTHDVSRILSVLGGKSSFENLPRLQQKNVLLNKKEYDIALKRLHFCLNLLMCLPGIPSIYYADEAGSQGLKDPFNRRTYPWERVDMQVFNMYSSIMNKRHKDDLLKYGAFSIVNQDGNVIIKRQHGKEISEHIFNNKDLSYKEH